MGFFQAVFTCFAKYFTLSGRAPRSEYWWWVLFLFVGNFVYTIALFGILPGLAFVNPDVLTNLNVDTFNFENPDVTVILGVIGIFFLFTILTIIPSFTVTVRRLHDTGHTGFWALVPIILNAASVWTSIYAADVLGGQGDAGSALLTNVLLVFIGIAAVIVGVKIFIWTLKAGTPGDNYFGPNPLGDVSYEERYSGVSSVPAVQRASNPSPEAEADSDVIDPLAMNHKEQVHALYKKRVIDGQAKDASVDVVRYSGI